MTELTITGDDRLDRKLRALRRSLIKQVVSPAVNKALVVLDKSITGQIPGKYKDVRATVGKRLEHSVASDEDGVVSGKVGFGVGKSRATAAGRGNKPGVGISSRNIHWAILGTGKRTTKTGKNRGEMPPIIHDAVQDGIAAGMGQAMSVMQSTIDTNLQKLAQGT